MHNDHEYEHDVVFIGGGHAAWHGALTLLASAKKVAIIERELVGGTCTNYGCNAKILLDAPSEIVSRAQRFDQIGFSPDFKLDWPKYMDYKHQMIDPYPSILKKRFADAGIEMISDEASFIDAHTLQVGEKRLTADTVVIGAGQRPSLPDIPGKEHLHDSRDFLDIAALPEHIIFIGAGIISLEFASLVTKLGTKATVITHGDRALRAFNADYVDRIVARLEAEGVDFHFNERISKVEKQGERYLVTAESGLAVEGSYVLDATSRQPNVEGLHLEKAGVEYGPHGIVVNEFMQANGDNVYASGDVVDKRIPKLTPTATFESNYIAAHILGNPEPIRYPAIPSVVFTLPRIAKIGVTVAQAKAEPERHHIAPIKFGQLLAFQYKNELDAEATVVLDEHDYLVGAELYGEDVGDMANVLAIIINKRMSAHELGGMIFAFPTPTDGLIELLTPMLHRD